MNWGQESNQLDYCTEECFLEANELHSFALKNCLKMKNESEMEVDDYIFKIMNKM